MLLNEEFMQIYEELDQLNEAKADMQNLIDFAGEDLANRFLNVKNRLKSPENDLYYWVKNKTPEDLELAITELENSRSATQAKKDIANRGAELIQETEHWRVYHITTFEASQKYGRDTKWCITGINDFGDKYWKDYTDKGIEFYFVISKDSYDPRGTDNKFAIAKLPDIDEYDIYNQQDEKVEGSDIPYYEEISVPGINLAKSYFGNYCAGCDCKLYDDRYEDGYAKGPDNNLYCEECFNELFFTCIQCGEVFNKDDDAHEIEFDEIMCNDCYSELADEFDDYNPNDYGW